MLLVLAALGLQAAPAIAPQPERWSILVPVPNEQCRPERRADDATRGGDVVVCGDALPSQRLPLKGEIVPDGPQPSNHDLSGARALALQATPCAAVMSGCTVGFGPPIAKMVVGAAGLVGEALKKHPDKKGRVPIPLDDPAPPAKAEVPAQ